jgi:alpha,alpha-trehalase
MLYALMAVGYQEEAADFIHWMERTIGSGRDHAPQILYGITGARRLHEKTLDLDGYRASRPVRIGNAAATQVQLDIYCEVLNAAYEHYGRDGSRSRFTSERFRLSTEAWALLRALVERAADQWTGAGNGIWEVRGKPQAFLYGRLMSWVALDRGIRLAQEHRLAAPLERWQEIRDRIRGAILEQGYNAKLGVFTQTLGGDVLDAAALMVPRMGLLAPSDPRIQSTVERIRKQLTHHGLVYRYRTVDGLAGGEGTFTLCTFWLVTALALVARVDEARSLFEHVLGYANDVGLFSEEIDPDSRELLGNFPQGFSHLALIHAAVHVDTASVAEGVRERGKYAGAR